MTDFVVADCGIRQLHARFVDAVWRQDATTFAACFATDGVWKIAGMVITGRDEIGEACSKLLGRCERIQLVIGQPILEVGDGTAIGRLQVTEFAKKHDSTSAITFGTYYDRYVEQDGAWRFQWRHWSMAYHGPVDMSGSYVVPPDYGPFPAMPGVDEPTFVRKVL
ncbi:nuclear transport factor 2 family protein [Sphingomonas sp. RT2P30]|uniref:nuclear transport factor 2 family protein n=1 Tax=Parasphingomonas halimpatiens TaxID=3096162 RepID=UPI002FC93607